MVLAFNAIRNRLGLLRIWFRGCESTRGDFKSIMRCELWDRERTFITELRGRLYMRNSDVSLILPLISELKLACLASKTSWSFFTSFFLFDTCFTKSQILSVLNAGISASSGDSSLLFVKLISRTRLIASAGIKLPRGFFSVYSWNSTLQKWDWIHFNEWMWWF